MAGQLRVAGEALENHHFSEACASRALAIVAVATVATLAILLRVRGVRFPPIGLGKVNPDQFRFGGI